MQHQQARQLTDYNANTWGVSKIAKQSAETSFAYDNAGRVTTAQDETGTINFAYNPSNGKPSSPTKTNDKMKQMDTNDEMFLILIFRY